MNNTGNEMRNSIHVGIVGSSGYAAEMFTLYQDEVVQTAVTAIFGKSGSEPGLRLGAASGVSCYTDWEGFLGDIKDSCDVVYNAAPLHLHGETTLQILEAGLPVWLEKPPVTNIECFTAVERKISQTGLSVDVCFNNIYNPVLRSLKHALQAGHFGKIKSINTTGGYVRDRAYFQRSPWAGRYRLGDKLVRDGSVGNALSHAVVNAMFLGADNGDVLDSIDVKKAHFYRVFSPESEDTCSFSGVGKSGIHYTTELSLAVQRYVPPVNRIETELGTILFKNYETVELCENMKAACTEKHLIGKLSRDVRIDMIEALVSSHICKNPSWAPFESLRPYVLLLERLDEVGGRPACLCDLLGLDASQCAAWITNALESAQKHETSLEESLSESTGQGGSSSGMNRTLTNI